MKPELLLAVYQDREIGRVERTGDRLRFVYDRTWRARGAFPLSQSMPLAATEHPHDTIEPFLWNLLPDNERTLEGWARRFHVSARSPFKLLSHIGEDCAGAISFVTPDRASTLATPRDGDVEWLTEDEIADRLRVVREDHSRTRLDHDAGQFSLAGAQPKLALLHRSGRWGVPSGGTPTTHILKPAIAELPGHTLNEHLCLQIARDIGLNTARSWIARFDDEIAIAIERYDRIDAHPVTRLHQEDLCQALALRPTAKYQNDGGPGPGIVVELLRTTSQDARSDVEAFVDALVFHWIIANTDAHAKNYSLLYDETGRVRLAPLYDLASALGYEHLDTRKLKLAMKIGRTYRIADVQPRDWDKLCSEIRADAEKTRVRIAELAASIRAALDRNLVALAESKLRHPILGRLESMLHARASAIEERYAR